MPNRLLQFLSLVLFIFLLTGCKEYKPLETDESFCTRTCIQKFESTDLNIRLRYPDGWGHSTQPGLVTLFYHGLKDSQEVIRSFIYFIDEHKADEDEMLSGYQKNIDFRVTEIKKQYADSATFTLEENNGIKFADKKWETMGLTYEVTVQGKKTTYTESYYLADIGKKSLVIKVVVEGQSDLSVINAEIDCILSKVEFID
ncbi:MAG TPA: hypothetical protein VGK59_13345 [Ohtaekwangia sp.]